MLHRPFQPEEIVAWKTNFTFIDSVWEIFGALLRGVPLLLIDDELLLHPSSLLDTLQTYHVTRITIVPSVLKLFITHIADASQQKNDDSSCVLPSLWLWLVSGELLTAKLLEKFQQCLPHATVLNLWVF